MASFMGQAVASTFANKVFAKHMITMVQQHQFTGHPQSNGQAKISNKEIKKNSGENNEYEQKGLVYKAR